MLVGGGGGGDMDIDANWKRGGEELRHGEGRRVRKVVLKRRQLGRCWQSVGDIEMMGDGDDIQILMGILRGIEEDLKGRKYRKSVDVSSLNLYIGV